MKEKILLVEDELELNNAIATILKFSNYEVEKCFNGKEALKHTKNDKYDLIVMDVMMPVMDGITALNEMKKIGISTPIILLTAKSATDDVVLGLDCGAEDYIAKPFETKELLARIRKILRKNNNKEIKIKNVIFNKETGEISNNKEVFELNQNEINLMNLLINNKDREVPKEEITARIFTDDGIKANEKLKMYTSFLNDKLNALGSEVQIKCDNGYILK